MPVQPIFISVVIPNLQQEKENAAKPTIMSLKQPNYNTVDFSFANFGTVELKNGFVYLHVDNGGQTWVFRVKDNDKIVFDEKKSDKCQLAENVMLMDGDTFVFWGN